MLNSFLIFLVILLLIVVFFSNKKQGLSQNSNNQSRNKLHKGYLAGLNFLLNEEPDKAVDIFIKMLEVDTDTIETHLALGHLFRKRGEVDRAIRIHQNLIARPNLSNEAKIQSLIALGQDYLSAGVLDRAERVFLEVIALDSRNKLGLESLRDIYQQEKEWSKAIQITEQISVEKGAAHHRNEQKGKRQKHYLIIAHYYCELADMGLRQKKYDQVADYIKKALSFDGQCIRANLLQADMFIQQKQYKHAIKFFKKILLLRPEFAQEIVDKLERCYLELDDMSGLLKTLNSMVLGSPCFAVFKVISKYINNDSSSYNELGRIVEEFMLSYPSIVSLSSYFNMASNIGDNSMSVDQLQLIQCVLKKLEEQVPAYQCKQCGYAGNIFQWQCPSCKYWGKTTPVLN